MTMKQSWLMGIWCTALVMKTAVAFPLYPMLLRSQNVATGHVAVLSHNQNSIQATHLFSLAGASLDSDAQPRIPTVEQLRSDPFMKQVQHAAKIVTLLGRSSEESSNNEPNPTLLKAMLEAQFSHSDGIRGFFVTYLTAEGTDTPADRPEVPAPLHHVLQNSLKNDDVIRLCCMNVLMPTGMTTLHQDPELAQSSRITAQRGIRILSALLRLEDENSTGGGGLVRSHCHAIWAAAVLAPRNENDKNNFVPYWIQFMKNWGYQELQKRDIAKAIQTVLSV